MILDTLLAWMHHLCLIAMAACLAMQWSWLAENPQGAVLRRLGRVDMAYGAFAMAMLAVGTARVVYGAKGADFYIANPVFWTKIAVFLLVGALSAIPTMLYTRWRNQARRQDDFRAPPAEVSRARRMIGFQALGWLALPALAAAMARGIGLG
jgi:putative membrane protein